MDYEETKMRERVITKSLDLLTYYDEISEILASIKSFVLKSKMHYEQVCEIDKYLFELDKLGKQHLSEMIKKYDEKF